MTKLDELLEDVEEVRRLTIRPGDTLVFRFKQRLSREVVDDIGQYVKEKLGEDIKLMILDQGTALDILEKTADAEAP